MKRFRNILFLADRDDGIAAGLERAVDLAGTNEARLTVMDVVPEVPLSGYLKRTYDIDLDEQMEDQRLRSLESLTRQYTDRGVPVYTTVARGRPFLEVIRAVQRNAHDLVIKVAEHNTGEQGTILGSTDMHLLRKCHCPVWIDRPGDRTAYRRILAAVDPFDDESGNLQRLILDLATSLAEREHANLEVIHAWELAGESLLRHGRGRVSSLELDLLLQATETRHREGLDALLEPYGLNTQDDGVHLIKGQASGAIIQHAQQQDIDVIVMGTLGRAGIAGLFIGNTAENVLRNTHTAVMTVKPDGFVTPVQ
jgi:nucleotide-binding universal stress UspA family protein